jgi:hypothetical protein
MFELSGRMFSLGGRGFSPRGSGRMPRALAAEESMEIAKTGATSAPAKANS